MNRLLAWLAFASVVICQAALAQDAGTPAQVVAPPKGKVASDLDRRVLEALLLNLLADKEFPPAVTADKPLVVLHRRTPEYVQPIVSVSQVSFDTGSRALPKEAWDDLIQRNVIRLNKYSREIHYEGLTFDPKIQVGNAFPEPEPPLQGKTFEEAFPQARAWVDAWVPGYSKDGKTAVVRANFGPAGKVATLTAILSLQGGKWLVIWRKFSVYG